MQKKKDNEGSPKKQRGVYMIVDMLLLDNTGPAPFCFAGAHDVEMFMKALQANRAEDKVVFLKNVRVGGMSANTWNPGAL